MSPLIYTKRCEKITKGPFPCGTADSQEGDRNRRMSEHGRPDLKLAGEGPAFRVDGA